MNYVLMLLLWKCIPIFGITPMKNKYVWSKGGGNHRSKCLQATTHTRAKNNDTNTNQA